MSDDFAVDPQAQEAGLPEQWREHVRELRSESARRRKENQDLRAQLAALEARAREAESAQAAACERAQREAARLSKVHRRLKEVEMSRLAREVLREAAARTTTAEGGVAARAVDVGRAQRLLERVPSPIDLDADLVVDDEGQVVLEAAAGERLNGYVEELVDLVSVEAQVAAPPVGGEPPRPADASAGRLANAWDPDGQRSPAAKARAALRMAAAGQGAALDALV